MMAIFGQRSIPTYLVKWKTIGCVPPAAVEVVNHVLRLLHAALKAKALKILAEFSGCDTAISVVIHFIELLRQHLLLHMARFGL